MKKTIINSMTIKRKKVINEGKTFAQAMGKRKLATNASSIAFYIFISLIPMLVLICAELPFTGISKRELTSAVTKITPQMVHGLISSMISQAYSSRIGVFSVSIILLIWSSSKGMLALIRSLDIVYEVQDSRNYITMVFFSIFCTMCLLLGASVLLVIYTKELSAEEILRANLNNETLFDKISKHDREFSNLSFLTILFATVYKFAPAGKRKFVYQVPGALFSSIAISIFSVYFAAYSTGSNLYNSFYGSLTSVTIFLVWIYSCINLFLVGGVLNSHYQGKIESFVNSIKERHIKRRNLRKQKKKDQRKKNFYNKNIK